MNYRSRKLTEDIIKGAQLLYTRVYTPFLMIPNDILPANSKIICLVLQCLAAMTYSNAMQLHDFNNDAMSKFTGIPAGTLNRILSNIENQVNAANNWLIENGFEERIQLTKLRQFSSATIYNYKHTQPRITETFNAAINEAPAVVQNEKPLTTQSNKKSEYFIEQDLKLKSLLKTGFDKDDLKRFFQYDIKRINRSVEYFVNEYIKKGKDANFNLLKLTIQKDWGRKYLDDTQKAIEYLKEIHAAIEVIEPHLTFEIKEKIKSAYKYSNPYDPTLFKTKSDVKKHCNYKINSLPEDTRKALLGTAARYADYLKHAQGFNGRTAESITETAQFAALQIIHNAINFNPIIKNIAA